jgi:hypothetical protein
MVFKAGDPKPEKAGRKPGTANKLSMEVRTAIQLAAYRLGGVDRLVAWAMESPQNEFAFWNNIWPRLAAIRIEGTGPGGALGLNLSIKFTREELARKLEDRGLPTTFITEIERPALELEVGEEAADDNVRDVVVRDR